MNEQNISHTVNAYLTVWLEAVIESSVEVYYKGPHVAHREGWLSNASFNKNEEISM